MRRERPPASRAPEKGYGEEMEFKGAKECRSSGVQEFRSAEEGHGSRNIVIVLEGLSLRISAD
jgi:hypothetical protein